MRKAFRRIRDVSPLPFYVLLTKPEPANTYLQIRRAGHWERGSMSTAYLSRLPREFMRVAAGFPRTAGNYHLQRAAVKPPAALTSQIWPWVDGWLARYDASIVS